MVILANRQAGVVSREQLLGHGFSEYQINWRVEHGLLTRIHHNVYAVGHRPTANRGYLLAALLSDLPGILRDLHHFLGMGPGDGTDAPGSER